MNQLQHLSRLKKRLFFVIFCFVSISFVQAKSTFFVSPRGNDKNMGTKEKPFATIEKAQTQVRKTKGKVTVYLREGVYYLNKAIVFTAQDTRNADEAVVYKNFDNEKVTVSGAVPLKLKWSVYKGNIFQAKVDGNARFDQLIVNGELQRMARYPNFDSSARFLGGTSADAISPKRTQLWSNPKGGFVHALHKHEWGDFHYLITGKKADGELMLEGGWQNNRKMGMHSTHRFVENIFEELDTVNEWFYDQSTRILYFYPPKNINLKTAVVETAQLAHLIEFKGSETLPVSNVTIEGFNFTGTTRTFMENREPLLRSDWTIYRGGAVLFDGAKYCQIQNCTFKNLGGNALFFNNYNRNCEVSGCTVSAIGASAFCFVGDPQAVRSPSFEYNEFVPLDKIDRTPGPKTNNYPADCRVYDNLMFDLGQVEKQSAGVELSMCQSITVSHNTMYDLPRAGINVSEGTWGGHIIEFNDVFNTVKESGDHGSFNSWGRDRYWHPDKKTMDSIVINEFSLTMLDVVKPIILRNNRMRCDHGWDIDLDDGSSNYEIYNNLCLNGGIKLREGVNRTVKNNIMINNSFHPHVWFKNSGDVFVNNIVSTGYMPIMLAGWGKEVDYNVFPDSLSLKASWKRNTDMHSVCGNPQFVDPTNGNYQVKVGSPALLVGFKNFDMSSFGVVSPRLKAVAKKVTLPEIIVLNNVSNDEIIDFMGAKVKNLSTLGEQSATGMAEINGVFVVDVPTTAKISRYLQPNDVILSFYHRRVGKLRDLLEARMSVIGSSSQIVLFRNQKELKLDIDLDK